MNSLLTVSRTTLFAVVALSIAGCGAAGTSTVAPNTPNEDLPVSETTEATLYLAGMNQELGILWGDWPNKVKQALLELDGVESVEDEWEREMESDEDLDLLFVTFTADRITVDEIVNSIRDHGFEAVITE